MSQATGLSNTAATTSVPIPNPAGQWNCSTLEGLSAYGLRREWRRLYHSEPPKISRDLLIRGIGYRLQEIRHGGLGKSTRRKLGKNVPDDWSGRPRSRPQQPGARLVREWHGRTHTVTVNEDGFEYAGMSYPSLTKVAKEITGAHWSGPRFFSLKPANAARPSNRDDNV